MAAFATTTWARRAGLAVAGRDWQIEFRILANGKRPTSTTTSLRSTELWMMIARDHYCVDIQHGGKRDSIDVDRGNKRSRTWNELGLPDPDLGTFATWLAAAEARFGKPFRRDRMWVQSNIKGGRDAVVTWIENGFVWPAS